MTFWVIRTPISYWDGAIPLPTKELAFTLIDARFGGDVMSLTEAMLDKKGVTQATAEARDRGFIEYGGTKFNDVQKFYSSVGDRNGISEYYMYDATNIRLARTLTVILLNRSLRRPKCSKALISHW